MLRYAVWYSGHPLRKKWSRVSSPAEDRQFSFLHRWYWKINISLPWNSTKESSIRISITSTSYRQEDVRISDLLLPNQNAQIPHREDERATHLFDLNIKDRVLNPQTCSSPRPLQKKKYFFSFSCRKKAGVENHNTPYWLSYPIECPWFRYQAHYVPV